MMMATMKISLYGFSLLLLSGGGSGSMSGLKSVVTKYYKHINHHRTWSEAQTYCRRHHTDLALLSQQSDLDGLQMIQYDAWIGLSRKSNTIGDNHWIWTLWSEFTPTDWGQDEPNNTDSCAYVSYPSQKVHGADCEEYHFFICYDPKPQEPQHQFIVKSKTWPEAQHYCKTTYRQELLPFTSSSYLKYIRAADFPVWIGLHSEDGQTWKWSAGSSEFRRWWPDGQTPARGSCVSVLSLAKLMVPADCSWRLPFICVGDNVLLVKERKSWEEALEHCRAINASAGGRPQYELVSVQPGEELRYMMAKARDAETDQVWVGLRFLAGSWLWVNGADMSHRDLPRCPTQWKHCGVLSRNNADKLETTDCAEMRNFLCYKKPPA